MVRRFNLHELQPIASAQPKGSGATCLHVKSTQLGNLGIFENNVHSMYDKGKMWLDINSS